MFPKSGAPMEREARLQGILHISQKPHLSGSPVKETSLKVPFMESLTERGAVTSSETTTRIWQYSGPRVKGTSY
jgi:hypothetical protein